MGDPGRSARAEGGARLRRAGRRRWPAWFVAVLAPAAAVTLSGTARLVLLGLAAAAAALGLAAGERDGGRWVRGAEGEEATAAILRRLPRSWAVLHDRRVPGSRANLDHLVIGRRGVWVVDSKAYRARLRVGWRGVRAGDRWIDTRPAAWEAEVASDRLGVEVVPVVAVHGRGLRRRGGRNDGVRVVPATDLVALLRREDRRAGGGRRSRAGVADLAERAAAVLPDAAAWQDA